MLNNFLHEVKLVYEGVIPEYKIVEDSYEFKDGMSLFDLTFAVDCNIILCKDICSPDTCREYDNVSLQTAAELFVVEFLGKKRKGATHG